MSERPVIREEQVESLFESKYIKVYDLQYALGRHYFNASRRERAELAAVKSDTEFQQMLPDAVTCIVIVKGEDRVPRLLLQYEYRYPAGRFLLSPPAGLIDPEDKLEHDPEIRTAKREIFEETGLRVGEEDRVFTVNPLVFSSPGMTDESNGLVCAVIEHADRADLSTAGLVGSELMDGFIALTEEEAARILRAGRDEHGNYYSVYTFTALLYFLTGLWKQEA